jgi:hypothetical protein
MIESAERRTGETRVDGSVAVTYYNVAAEQQIKSKRERENVFV